MILDTARKDAMPLPIMASVRQMMADVRRPMAGANAYLFHPRGLRRGRRREGEVMNGSQRITIPGTELSVSKLCLGGNRLGGALNQAKSFALLDAWVATGANFIDTAHVYANWLPDAERSCSEKTLGRWLKARGGSVDVVIATKGGHPRDGNLIPRLDRATVRQDVAEALDYLGLARLDLFYLHRDDPSVPVEDAMAVVEDLRREGLIRHYACSNWSAPRMAEIRRGGAAQWLAGLRGPPAGMEPRQAQPRHGDGRSAGDGRRHVRLPQGERHDLSFPTPRRPRAISTRRSRVRSMT